ncbi:MAG: DUF3387 domain-containing protein [Paracoccaceae bacterium]|nr:DUF3387 domain-containing protein [Paracoccaceae bacterium]MDE2914690.1 DUF3387 domain-containing protein [Paracoccaceae bacterium]
MRVRMRVLVKRILRKRGYPRGHQDAAAQTVLQRAEALSVGWAAQADQPVHQTACSSISLANAAARTMTDRDLLPHMHTPTDSADPSAVSWSMIETAKQ